MPLLRVYADQAELAFAAYSLLFGGISGDEFLGSLEGAGMSPPAAARFVERWRVLAQEGSGISGLSVTVFEETASGIRNLAIRGTDDGIDLVTDLVNIGVIGAPLLHPQYLILREKVRQWLADGTLAQSFTVTGHSLGGFLATGLVAEFPDNVAHAFLFNSPGLGGIQGGASAAILQAVGVMAPFDPGKITNIKADAGISPIAGFGVQIASPEWITIENQYSSDVINPPGSRNHALQVLTDALALHGVLGRLDTELSTKQIGQILRATSNQNRLTLEAALDALRMTLLGSEVVKGKPTVEGNRESLYQNLYELEETAIYRFLPGNARVRVLLDTEAESLASLAKSDFGHFLALCNLLPFAIEEAPLTLWSAHGELFDRWQSDQEKRAIGSIDLSFSDSFLADRAEMLGWKNRYYENDGNVALRGNRVETYEFTDRTIKDDRTGQDLTITVVGRDTRQVNNPAKVIFGSDADETLVGGNVAAGDRLYGGRGADVLQGNEGNDYLEGGSGSDTYVWNTGDGFDTIRDSDGSGLLVINGVTVSAGFQLAQGLYISNDEKIVLGFDGDLVAGGTLTINADLRVEGFKNGNLGIHLENASNIALIQPTINALEGVEGIRGATDGNDLFFPSLTGTFFFARGGDDLSQPAPDLPSTAQMGDSGDDILFGGAGSFDSLWGGAGRDVLHGGDGNDLLVGDFDRAEFYRAGEVGAPDLDFDIYYPVSGGFRYSFRYVGTRDPGDFYDISVGGYYLNDPIGALMEFSAGWEGALRYVLGIGVATDTSTLYDDVLHGGAGNDTAFGGPGSDNIMGGDGDDTLHGDYGGANPVSIAESDLTPEQVAAIRALLGKPGDDYLDGGDGNDVISDVDGGHDILIGGDGADHLVSEDPADSTTAFHNLLDGEGGDDILLSVNRSAGGHDTLLGGEGNDVIEVRVGSAYVQGGSGSDTYIVRDALSPLVSDLLPRSLIINDFDELSDGVDRLQITLSSSREVLSITRDDVNLYFGLGDNPAWITVENWFGGSGYKLEEVVIDDPTTQGIDEFYNIAALESRFATPTASADLLWGTGRDDSFAGGKGEDSIFGAGGNDILAGNEGSDFLDGGEGSDTYVFNVGDGVDRIFDSGNFGNDVIAFGAGITQEMLTLGLGSMLIRVGENGDAIHLDGFDPHNARGSGNIEYFQFADGTVLSYQELLDRGFDIDGTEADDVLEGTSVNDRLAGGPGNDTYVFGRGSGQDVIVDHDPDEVDNDSIRIGPDIAPSDVTVSRDGDFITLAISETSDQLSILWQPEAGYRIESVEFADGTLWSAVTLEALSAGNNDAPPSQTDPPEEANGTPVTEEVDCRDLIGHRERAGPEGSHRGRHRRGEHLDDHGDWPKYKRDPMTERLASYLAQKARFEFETLLEEPEGTGPDNLVRNRQAFERGWRAVGRFAATQSSEHDDSILGAPINFFFENGFFGEGALSGFFGSQGRLGGMIEPAANLLVFRGLEDGFRNLHR